MFSTSKLKEYRLAKKLSQTAIAKELGVTRSTLSAWETGKTVPNKKHLQELAQIFHIKPNDLQEEHPHLNLYQQLNQTNKKRAMNSLTTFFWNKRFPTIFCSSA